MRLLKIVFGLIFSYSSLNSYAFLELDFKLEEMNKEQCAKEILNEEKALSNLIAVIEDPKFWSSYLKYESADHRLNEKVYVVAYDKNDLPPEEFKVLGMTAREALLASRDDIQTIGCAHGHDQGDLANRWCHSAVANSFASWLERRGLNSTVASIAGGMFWVPKEFFYDLNPSAHDIVFTFKDKLGTKSTTFEVSVFGDTFYKKFVGDKMEPFKGSTPFLVIKRKF